MPRWATFRDEAEAKLEKHENVINHVVHKTRDPVDPLEIEYFRGFRQGVKYLLYAMPAAARAELDRLNQAEESDQS